MLRVAERLGDTGLVAMAHYQLSTTLLYMGEVEGFFEQRERMSAFLETDHDRSMVARTPRGSMPVA